MGRRPKENEDEERDRPGRQAVCRRRPADHRRQRARGAADDDVERRPALQNHRIERDVDRDGEREQSRGEPIDLQPQRRDGDDREQRADRQRLIGRHGAARNGAHGGPRHLGVDVGFPPHVERAAGPGPGRHRGQRRHKPDPVDRSRRQSESDRAGEDDKRHHARLQENEVVDHPSPRPLARPAPVAASARNRVHANRHPAPPNPLSHRRRTHPAIPRTIRAPSTVDRPFHFVPPPDPEVWPQN